MPTPTPTNPMAARWLDDDAWTLAFEAAAGSRTSDHAPEWTPLVQAGVATAAGQLNPRWSAALTEHLNAPVSLAVTATYNGLAHRGEVRLGGRLTTSLMRRFRTETDGGHGIRPVAMDTASEFCLTAPDQAWPMVRRMLPPLDALRARPHQTPAEDRTATRISITPDEAAGLLEGDLEGDEVFPEAVRSQVDSDTTVTLVASTIVRAGRPDQSRLIRSAYFVVDGDDLRELTLEGGRPAIVTVRPGQVGFAVWWLVEGLVRAHAEAGREVVR